VPSADDLQTLVAVLGDARTEQPLQELLAARPVLLRVLVPAAPDVWIFDRRKFGSEFIPDFLIAYRNSTGICWSMVELESPGAATLTAKGRPAAKLAEALGQIRDWRMWLRKNIAYARNELGLTGLDAEAPGVVVIGRRAGIKANQAERYRELAMAPDTVMSYDRLIEMAKARRSDSAQ